MIPLNEFHVYQVSMEIGEMVWKIVDRWSYFSKDTLGKQLVKSADSIALNIAEGYGRYFYKENRVFCYYSRGSAKETLSAITKAKSRNLITSDESESLNKKLDRYFSLMAGYIKSIGNDSTSK